MQSRNEKEPPGEGMRESLDIKKKHTTTEEEGEIKGWETGWKKKGMVFPSGFLETAERKGSLGGVIESW